MEEHDGDEYEGDGENGKYMEKRSAHSAAEQKRRDAIKKGVEVLQNLVPGCAQSEVRDGLMTKTSKAQVLQKTIDFIHFAAKDREKKLNEIEEMEKKLKALKIMAANYKQLVEANKDSNLPKQEVSDEVKFDVFKHIANFLWATFSTAVCVKTFETLSACIIQWMEEYCKPENMKTAVIKAVKLVFGG